MSRPIRFVSIFLFVIAGCRAPAQSPVTTASPARSWTSRVLHPFASKPEHTYKDPRLHGLELEMQVSPQPVKLGEVRQLEIKIALTNGGKQAVELAFPTEQRLEIYLRNTAEKILTKWSENHAFAETAALVLINPGERLEYTENIATRELTAGKVFVAEAFFPQYPELTVRQKFRTEP